MIIAVAAAMVSTYQRVFMCSPSCGSITEMIRPAVAASACGRGSVLLGDERSHIGVVLIVHDAADPAGWIPRIAGIPLRFGIFA